MKINKLKLRGAIGIWKGLGQEEIEIDFTRFGPGLIALTGKNGAGKTTIMENLHPYRTMVSRTGSLQSHFFLKDSYRILEFEHNGESYKAQIYIDALTGGSEAYLYKNNSALNDGKLTTYDEAIESVLGSQELFFNSVFSGQKSKGIAELKPAERRKLFYELLNLNVYEKYLEEAKAELKSNELKLSEIEGKISALERENEDPAELESELARLDNDRKIISHSLESTRANLESIRERMREAEISKVKYEEKKEANAEIEKRLASIGSEIDELTEKTNSRVREVQGRILENERAVEAKQTLLGSREEINLKIEAVKELTEKIEDLKSERERLHDKINGLQERVEEMNGKLSEKNEELLEASKKKETIKRKIEKYNSEIEQTEKNTALIGDVPCDETTGASCMFLKNAFEGKNVLPELRAELSALKEKYDEADAEWCDLDDERIALMDSIMKLKNQITYLRTQVDAINKEISAATLKKAGLNEGKLEALKKEIATAENDVELLIAEEKHLVELIDEARRNFDERLEVLKKEAGKLQANHTENIEGQIEALDEAIAMLRANEVRLAEEIKAIEESITEIDRETASLNGALKTVKRNQVKIEELEWEKRTVQNEIKDWTFLAKAFDKTGIPVLKLENSGIQITSIANELLSLFDNQFRIVFETTQLTKDKKKLKETFNVNVLSGDDVVEISNLSGGQQVFIETAIRLAIANLVKSQNRNIQTSFLDEADGPLDINNAYHYIEMINKAHKMSGVYSTFVITHRPELLELIPQKIELSDGMLKINGGIYEENTSLSELVSVS